jgi:hypothetical protein
MFMKRVAAVALVVVWFAFSAFAQRGMSRGGFSGHTASAFHGGFAAPHFSGGFGTSHSYGFAGGSRYPVRSFMARPGMAYRGSVASGFRSPYRFRSPYMGAERRDGRYRRRHSFGYGAPAFYAVPQWIGLGPLGYYPDDFDYGDSAASSDDAAGNYGPPQYDSQGYEEPPPADTEQPVFHDNYEAAGEMPPPPPPPSPQVPENEDATTIVFKDGRPPEQIHNYALTRTTLFVLDQQRRDIPLDQVDLAATEKANRAAGIRFQIPQIPE